MDGLDRKIVLMMEREPRMTIRSMARILGLPVATVQRRVEGLFGSGRIGRIRACLNWRSLGGIEVMIYGAIRGDLPASLFPDLAAHGSIRFLIIGMNNRVQVNAVLRGPDEIDDLLSFMKERIGLHDHSILVPRDHVSLSGKPFGTGSGKVTDPSILTDADLRIVRSLNDDGRKAVSNISKETGLSTRTVRSRLEKMMASGAIEFFTNYDFSWDRDVWFILRIEFISTVSRDAFIKELRTTRHPFDEATIFLNAPDTLTLDGLIETIAELDGIIDSVLGKEGVVSVTPDIVRHHHAYDTWVDRASRGNLS